MRKHILLYGLAGGALIVLLRVIEYQYLVLEWSVEIYGGLIAILFSACGIWLGLKLTKPRERVVIREAGALPASGPIPGNAAKREQLGVTPRELEILTLIAAGLSTREIADRVHVTENTVKTHSRRLFDKLGARRRTQAVQLAKESGLLS